MKKCDCVFYGQQLVQKLVILESLVSAVWRFYFLKKEALRCFLNLSAWLTSGAGKNLTPYNKALLLKQLQG